jgi:hypothetical protein
MERCVGRDVAVQQRVSHAALSLGAGRPPVFRPQLAPVFAVQQRRLSEELAEEVSE